MSKSIFLTLILTFGFAGVGLADPDEFSVEDYADLVHRYLKGGFTETVNELSEVSKAKVEPANQDYRGGWLDERQLKAAALLHTQVAWATAENESFHLQAAREFLEQIEDESERARFLGRWYLAVGYYLYEALLIMPASIAFEAALRWMPDNPESLLAKGSLIECSAWMVSDGSKLGEAQQAYTKLLDKEPENAEVRVRLGHLHRLWERIRRLQARGTPEKVPKRRWYESAEKELKRALMMTEDPNLTPIAHLLLGDIYRDRNQNDRAVDSYTIAIEIDPTCQPASIALSLALRETGDREASERVLQRFLKSRSERTEEHDVWWRFLRGQSHHASTVLQELREEMRQ